MVSSVKDSSVKAWEALSLEKWPRFFEQLAKRDFFP